MGLVSETKLGVKYPNLLYMKVIPYGNQAAHLDFLLN